MGLGSILNKPLVAGKKITVKQAIINVSKLGRKHRRNLCRRIFDAPFSSTDWKDYRELEDICLGR